MTDVIDRIDDAVSEWTEWHGSVDSATWIAPWDEPIIEPGDALRRQMDRNGWDGYTARAVATQQLRTVVASYKDTAAKIVAAFQEMARAIQTTLAKVTPLQFALVPPSPRPIDDQRARALDLVRMRSTGPAPRRLDGRRRSG
ncbi:MAG: hypothetical protein JWM93_2473 [Frankiales bacterium]|nr:hypothetical protein [Frankiales bacterium]